ncbi:MAG TPA: guanylate kinase [Marinilabiliales bacterium]|jgi:guanylate kinase|nr:MAG: guanylate kinase [Bacteroidetes bacterium GWA2_40_14]OFX59665.1 MAG: guanylate kinase [Bacteroidetes bacterium GWC2_40_13]OFX74145.1 MAG: guanylate kinase [Bacteroidetes bacterium GWD2_40_43]OFX93022.1 MAG: guanylate kinase [Bacteroidetes bacterium GWE2_40_63]OFY21391.1 MAG: guanylate kinase [Bacteroidetes bacterium GWF2_40_13]OFZ31014.1 MAG: guanylate kinase [Bacteroidetes bacterium RIFOXYC2_FULL_40_12]HAM98225.1 guanylate kinase [Marinilabiliales bacterium]
MDGKLVIFSAPSGAGKTTIVRHLLDKGYRLEFSISACNRVPRGKEEHGKDYYFLTTEEFQRKIHNQEFVEWEEVYEGRFYGTLRSELERIWQKGFHVLFDVDVVGGINLKKHFGNRAMSIFVMPPSVEALRERLHQRATDEPTEIERRLSKAKKEMSFANQFDHVIVNDDLSKAIQEAEELLSGFINAPAIT